MSDYDAIDLAYDLKADIRQIREILEDAQDEWQRGLRNLDALRYWHEIESASSS